MNARFLVPASVALAIHGGLFFGFPNNHRAAKSPAKEPVIPGPTFVIPPEVDVILLAAAEPPSRRGEEELRPPSPEPVVVAKPDVDQPVMPRPPIVPGPVGDSIRIVDIGVPHGAIDSTIRTVGIFNPAALDNPPRTRFQAAPFYPPEKRKLGETGEVWVEFDVDAAGAVHNPRVTKSSDRAFEEPTLRAVAKWRFEPGKRHGKVVAFRMTVPVIFSLND